MAKRDYQNDYPSVTTILGILRKPALENWFRYNTAQFCKEESAKGKIVGSQIHQAIEDQINGKEVKIETTYVEEVKNGLNSFILFKKEHPEIEFVLAEQKLTSEVHKFNGTMDVKTNIGSAVIIGDWKTSRAKKNDIPPIYDEYIYQVSAYLKLFNEVENQNVKQAFVAVFAKDKVAYNYELFSEERINEVFEEVFLPALKICSYGRRKK